MKLKTLLCAATAICAAYVSNAQVTAKVGPEFGLGINSMVISDHYNGDEVYAGGFVQVGGTADIQFGRWFAIRPSLMFNFNTNESGDDIDYSDRINTSNIYLPVDALATFRFRNGSKMFVGFGPYMSYTLGGKYKYHVYDINGNYVERTESLKLGTGTDKHMKPLDLGLNFKMGFQMRNNLFMNFSFNLGITDRAPHDIDGYKIKDQQLFAFGIGYLFGPKEETRSSKHHSRYR